MIKLKRAYETPDKSDGIRVLVERLWPRGVRKEDAPDHNLAQRACSKHRVTQVV